MSEIELVTRSDYPKIKQLRKNSYYHGLLQNLYAGQDSETTIFHQLRYQYYMLSGFNDKIAEILNGIALSDLKHHELLAEAIKMVGGDPVLCSAQGKWFGGRSIDYIKDTKQILLLDIEAKEKAIIDYRTTISKIENTEVLLLLESIVADEERHKLLLKKLIRKL